LPSGNKNMRLLGITESKCGIPQQFLASVNSKLMSLGEGKRRREENK
jgi:hypothetical protein